MKKKPQKVNATSPLNGAKQLAQQLTNAFKNRLIDLLYEKDEATVGELVKITGWEQSVVSQQLAGLRKLNFVSPRRDGKFIYYSLNARQYEKAVAWAEKGAQLLQGS